MDRKEAAALLGVDADAEAADIVKAFRKRALALHPDVSKSSDAKDRFIRLRAAHDLLMANPAEGAAVPSGDRQARNGADIRFSISIPLELALSGGEAPMGASVPGACAMCGGSGRTESVQRTVCGVCSGDGVIVKTRGLLRVRADCVTCKGTGTIENDRCLHCGGSGQAQDGDTATVPVPPGVKDGEELVFPGRGGRGTDSGHAGPLIVTVHVAGHPRFTRRGNDLLLRQAVPFADLCLGGRAVVETLDRRRISIRIAAGTQPGKVIRIEGHGMPFRKGRGNLLVRLEAAIPERLTEQQRALLESWRKLEKVRPPP